MFIFLFFLARTLGQRIRFSLDFEKIENLKHYLKFLENQDPMRKFGILFFGKI